MLEITPDNALTYLRDQGWLDPGPVQVSLLGGGVSNIVLRVQSPRHDFVLKQSRPQLRTRDAWFSDLDRVYREQEVMQMLAPLLPTGTVPRILHVDRDNYLFIMSAAPAGARVWKELLLAGQVEESLGGRAGLILGRMHEATAGHRSLLEAFRDHTVFVQLRVDPFYRRIQERRPEVAEPVGRLIDDMLSRKEALCHGDYTPKNLLVHDDGFSLVDYETAHFGEPAMDLGLFLCHLVLKAFRERTQRHRFFGLTQAFWQGYRLEISFQPIADLERRGIQHFAACLLARIDGTSPVDYLPHEPTREAVRDFGRRLLWQPPACWDEVLALGEQAMSS
jgi:5-methylthioribose kinase